MSAPNIEAERAVALENFWDNATYEETKKLEDYFIDTLEYGGIPITKDNVESLFDRWSEELSLEEIENIL